MCSQGRRGPGDTGLARAPMARPGGMSEPGAVASGGWAMMTSHDGHEESGGDPGMTNVSSEGDVEVLIAEGRRLLRVGEWAGARESFEQANARRETPEALEGRALAARWETDERTAFETAMRAFELYRARGDNRGAARAGFMLADHSLEWRGEMAVAQAWIRRIARLLAGDEESEEYGRLLFYEGYLPLMEVNDTAVAIAKGQELTAHGARLGSLELEMIGMALEGLGMVSAGRVAEGMARLDDAAIAALGGEALDPEARGTACCFVIDACGRVRDFDRAGQWSARMEELCEQLHIQPFFAICRPNFAQVLIWRGMWAGAESQLTSAIRELEVFRAPMAVEGVVRLAELRCRQGRLDEAANLFASVASEPLAQLGQAQLALARGDAATAIDFCDRYMRRIPEHARAERAAGLELLVSALLARDDLTGARAAAEELATLAHALGTVAFTAASEIALGSVAEAEGDLAEARRKFEDAADRCGRAGGAFDCARARLEVARVLAAEGRPGAVQEAATAVADLERMGAGLLVARGRDLLASLGADQPRPPDENPAGLSQREVEVLALIAQGLSNGEIADALVISVRTVERHISNIYAKVGADGPSARTIAAAFAVRHKLI